MKKLIMIIFLFLCLNTYSQNIFKIGVSKVGVAFDFGYIHDQFYQAIDFSIPIDKYDDGYLNMNVGILSSFNMYQNIIIGLYSKGRYYPDKTNLYPNVGIEIGYKFKHCILGLSLTNMTGFGIKGGIVLNEKESKNN